MPIQQITVVPARESSGTGKSSSRSKDKSEGKKAPGRSGSRSSNISKVSNSTGLTTASRTSVTPSSQDICSPLSRLEEETASSVSSVKHENSSTMTAANALSSSDQKKQVKRRHRRRGPSCDRVDPKPEQGERSLSLSSDRSEKGEKRERPSKNKRDLPPRLRSSSAPQTDSSSEEESWRQARSWSKEKARRARRRSRDREGDAVRPLRNQPEEMELQSITSDEEKENQEEEEEVKPKERQESRASSKQEEEEVEEEARETSVSQVQEKESSGSSTPATEEEERPGELITKRYQERGPGSADMSVPTPQANCTGNGTTTLLPCSDSETEVCRICHCEGDDECPLIMPCRCTGSLCFVHQSCLNQWIKSSDTRCCELCKFDFIMETKLKPLRKWEKLQMTKGERRKIFCSVLFHLIAIACMLWSVYILVKRTAEEVRLGKNDEFWRVSLLKYYTPEGVLEWPFWTKLIVVAIGLTGGLIFMYIQSKVYLQLWQRLKAFNRIITVQNCPDKELHNPQARNRPSNGGSVEVPVSTQAPPDSDMSVEAAAAPAQSPV